ncbi:MAG: hypothetical protein ACR2OV_09655 [Hyphomicrobiaceae bacterium]
MLPVAEFVEPSRLLSRVHSIDHLQVDGTGQNDAIYSATNLGNLLKVGITMIST